MSKNTRLFLYLLLILLPIYIVSYLVISSRRDLAGKLLKIKSANITAIEVTNAAGRSSLKKQGTGFVFTEPFSGIAADDDSTKKFFNLFSKLTVKRDLGVYDENGARTFGITASSPKVQISEGDKKTVFILGRRSTVEPQSYIYNPETKKLLLTENIAEVLGNVKPEDFRERRLFNFEAPDIKSVDVQLNGGRRMLFNKEGADWYVSDMRTGRRYLCDGDSAAYFAALVAKTSIIDFTPLDHPVAKNTAGLNSPRATLAITTSSAPVHRLEIGNTYDKDRLYTALDGAPSGGIPSQFLLQLSTPTASYFRTTLADFMPGRIARFTSAGGDVPVIYEKNRGRWYRTAKKKRPFEDEKIELFMNVLFNLKIGTFIFDEPLGTVEKEYTFYDRDGKTLMNLQIGGKSGEYRKVQFKDKHGVFGIDRAQIEALDL